jgi:hypothetical protein
MASSAVNRIFIRDGVSERFGLVPQPHGLPCSVRYKSWGVEVISVTIL